MNKRTFTTFAFMLSFIVLLAGTATAQLFDVDASDIQKGYAERHDSKVPQDIFEDPDNVERFLQQFYRSSDRIVGGEDVDIKDYPWQASLQLQPQFGGAHFCGAVLVDEYWAITAAHCLIFDDVGELDPSQVRLRVGFTSMSSTQGFYHNINDLIIYPEYDDDGNQYDIALINLSAPIDLENENMATVGRVTQDDAAHGMTDPGEMVKVSGWGALSSGGPSPDILQAIEVPIVDVTDTNYPPSWITDDMIIAGAPGMDSCQGDSGGPMVVEDGEGWYKVAGIVSFGVGCGDPGYPGVYARVSYFENWLDEFLVSPDPNQYYTFHLETFGDGDVPQDWTNEVIEGPDGFPGWEWTDTGGSFGGQLNSTTAHDGYMMLDSDGHGTQGVSEEADLISPSMDFSDIDTGIHFSVEHLARTFGNADIRIYISTDNFNTQTELYRWHDAPHNDFNGPNPVVSAFDITDIAQGESDVRIKFKWIGAYDYWWLVDDFKIQIENPSKQVHFAVTDGEEPLDDVFITTQYSDQETTTDANGEAELTLYEGTYEITATKEGFFDYEETIDVTEDGQVVHIEMDKIPAPEIVIDTDEIELTLPQGNSDEVVVNIANPGDAELEYALFVYPAGKAAATPRESHETAHYEGYDAAPGTSLSAELESTPGNMPEREDDADKDIETVEIHHDNGYANNGVGTGGAASFITAARFTAEELAEYYGMYELSAVKYHIRSDDFTEVSIKVWEGGSDAGPGTEVYSQEVTDEVIIEDWSTHVLDETIELVPGEEYWLGYAMEATGGHPASVDSGPMVEGKGGWMYFQGSWSELTDLGALDFNWTLRGILQLSEQIDWLTFNPQSGEVAPESDMDVDFIFDAEGLEVGAHHAEVMVQNNAGGSLTIPVTLMVDPAEYDVTFEVIDQDGNDIEDATISLGTETNAPGDYMFFDIPVGIHGYEVTKSGYHDATGQIHVVDQDLVFEVILLEDDTDTVTLNVSIEDEFEDPVEAAYFHIQGFGGQISDSNGNLSITLIPGTYDYTVLKTGFEDIEDEVTITSDSEQFLDITMTYLRFDVTLDINMDEAGTVTGAGEYHYGQTATIEAIPNTGYHFVHWLEHGVELTTDEEYSFVVTEDRSFSGVFDINTYIITSSFEGNGGIDPLGEIEVTHGDDVTFTIAPTPGNYIVDVLVNDESVGPVEEYTFENVTEDGHTIHAEFALITHEVTITSEGNGTVDPSGTIDVPHGDALLIEFTPDEDHHVADVLINNNSVGAHDEYLINSVTGNTSVHVVFEFSVGIDELDELPALTVFPNPAADHVTVSGEEVIREIRLYNLTGQTIKTVQPESREYQMNTSQLQSGMYLLQVSFDHGVQTVSLKVE